jgi:hypothetical protein
VPRSTERRDEYLKVHDQGPGHADVTEGSRGVWERLHYDWSDPNRVIMTTTDSNVWGGGSGHTYTFTRHPKGATDVDVVVVREGKNVKGRVIGIVLGTVGKRAWRANWERPSRPSKPGTTAGERRKTTSSPRPDST